MATHIIAHRGASKYAPENTLPAFELAYQSGADGIETDVQLTKDNIPVLIHDEKLHRTTGGKGLVHDYTFAELQKLDAGSWFSDKYRDTKIMALEEFLEWIKNKPLLLHLELKNNVIDYPGLEKAVYELLLKYNLKDRTNFSSFNPVSMERFKHIDRTVPTALLLSQKKKDYLLAAGQTGVSSLHVKYRLLSKSLMQQAIEKNFSVRVYTVNRRAHLERCFSLGCHGVFTDVPDMALAYRNNQLFI